MRLYSIWERREGAAALTRQEDDREKDASPMFTFPQWRVCIQDVLAINSTPLDIKDIFFYRLFQRSMCIFHLNYQMLLEFQLHSFLAQDESLTGADGSWFMLSEQGVVVLSFTSSCRDGFIFLNGAMHPPETANELPSSLWLDVSRKYAWSNVMAALSPQHKLKLVSEKQEKINKTYIICLRMTKLLVGNVTTHSHRC